MAAHRYWRVLLGRSSTNPQALKEVQMRATVGGANACTGGTALASGVSGGSSAANAFDGNSATEWSADSANALAWIGYDFGTPIDIAEIVLTHSANSSSLAPFGWLQYSDDGSAWVLLAPYLPMTVTAGAVMTFSGFADVGTIRAPRLSGHISLGYPAGLPGARRGGAAMRHDPVDGGPLRVAGDVGIKLEDGGTGTLITGVDGNQIQPLRRRVRLLQRLTARLVREAWSNAATGAYEFTSLKDQDYLVVVDDYALVYNAVAADAVRPVP